ncbi:MAG: RHS repeat-associated core domain-containing protein, partial [Coriobacteriia bacterium]|nr:RHS repeat-associated core domain-containing protein [Coriobacteriia bacterium]
GLYYLSARYYDPATYQFLSKDPARDDGEESAYQYCGGDPVGSIDPTGLWTLWLPGVRLIVDYLYFWYEERWLWSPGGAPSGLYKTIKREYEVTLKVNKLWLGIYGLRSLYALGLRYAAVEGSRRFLLTSPARIATYNRMRDLGRALVLTKYLARSQAWKRVSNVLTRAGYIRDEKYWVSYRFTVVTTDRGTRIRS